MATPIPYATAAAALDASQLLGSGSTGDVFRGILRDAPVAVKRLKLPPGASPEAAAALYRRFHAELGAIGAFSHPRIVRLLHYAVSEEGAPPLLVFELLEAGSLADWLRGPRGEAPRQGPALSAAARVEVALGVAHGLGYLHGLREPGEVEAVGGGGGGGGDAPPLRSIVHRDVKAANVGLTRPAGGALFAKVLDCGLAKALRGDGGGGGGGGGATWTAGVLGTPGYMAPELADGDYSIASEVYSFGVVLLELFAGQAVGPRTASEARRAAEDAGPGALARHAEPGAWPPAAVEPLAALIGDCLQAREERRPRGMAALIPRLRALRALLPGPPAPPTTPCPVCLEDVPACDGVTCRGGGAPASAAARHFICRGCLLPHVVAASTAEALRQQQGAIPCATAGCAAPGWRIEDLQGFLDVPTTLAYALALRYSYIDVPARRREEEAALAAREAAARALADAAERARQLRLLIVERDLSLRCPSCLAVFTEWTGCAALACADEGGRRGCGAGFCGLCLERCGRDAHAHVQQAHGKLHFSAQETAEAHRGRREALVVAALRALAGEPALQGAVWGELAKADLPGAGLDPARIAALAGVAVVGGGGGGGEGVGQPLPPDATAADFLRAVERAVQPGKPAPVDSARLRACLDWLLAPSEPPRVCNSDCWPAARLLVCALEQVPSTARGAEAELGAALCRALGSMTGGRGDLLDAMVGMGKGGGLFCSLVQVMGGGRGVVDNAELAAAAASLMGKLCVGGGARRKGLCVDSGGTRQALLVIERHVAHPETCAATCAVLLLCVSHIGAGVRNLGLWALLEDAMRLHKAGTPAHGSAADLLRALRERSDSQPPRGTWACPACTLLNPARDPNCGACGGPRP